MELRGEQVVLRPLRVDDAPRLAEFGADPEVARWWPGIDEAELIEKAEGRDDTTCFAVLHEDDVAGLIQYGEELDPQYRHASIDLFLDPALQGRGVGPEALRRVVRHLIDDRGHHRITIDPAAANAAAIRAYEKVGFRPVGVMRRYERDADGEGWHDGLLMELVVPS